MPSDRIFFSRLRVFPTHSASLLDSSTTALVLAAYQRNRQEKTLTAELKSSVYYFVPVIYCSNRM